mgnify:CR=1 FL=1|jgi:copper chaperone CopZ
MKLLYVIIYLLIIGCSAPTTLSRKNNPDIVSVKIDLPSVQCDMCKQIITEGLTRMEGVQTAYVNLNEKKILIKYDKNRLDLIELGQNISKLGYQAGDMSANVEAYNNLPNCCKFPEDR